MYVCECVCVQGKASWGNHNFFFFLPPVTQNVLHTARQQQHGCFLFPNKVKLKIHFHHYEDLGLDVAPPEGADFLLLSKNKGLRLYNLDYGSSTGSKS